MGYSIWRASFGLEYYARTLEGDRATLSPSHTGTQPASYESDGITIRPLGREVDKTFALLLDLDKSQRKQAVLGVKARELTVIEGNSHDAEIVQAKGIKGSALTEKQRDLLLDLIGEWTGIPNPCLPYLRFPV